MKSFETLEGIALVVGPITQGLVEALMGVVSGYPVSRNQFLISFRECSWLEDQTRNPTPSEFGLLLRLLPLLVSS